jgi:hypothetical protein
MQDFCFVPLKMAPNECIKKAIYRLFIIKLDKRTTGKHYLETLYALSLML